MQRCFCLVLGGHAGVNVDILVHPLIMQLGCWLIIQNFGVQEARVECKNKRGGCHIEAGFLKAMDYPEWLDNTVLVAKKDGKVKKYVGYKDLNKSNCKDEFSITVYPCPHGQHCQACSILFHGQFLRL